MSILSSVASRFDLGKKVANPKSVAISCVFTSLVDEYVDALHTSYFNVLPKHVVLPDIIHMNACVKFLLQARVAQVDGKRLPYKPGSAQWVIPHGLFAVLSLVGRVRVKDFNLTLEPKFDDDKGKKPCKVSRSDADVMEFFRAWDHLMPVAEGLPRDAEGDLEFMMLTHIDNAINSGSPDADPGVVLASALINNFRDASVFNPMVTYGLVEDHRSAVRVLASSVSGKE